MEDSVADAEKHLTAAIDLTRDLQAPLAAWRIYQSLGELYDATRRRDQARTSFATALQILKFLAENAEERSKISILESETARELEQRCR
jgi:hypothetical protein